MVESERVKRVFEDVSEDTFQLLPGVTEEPTLQSSEAEGLDRLDAILGAIRTCGTNVPDDAIYHTRWENSVPLLTH